MHQRAAGEGEERLGGLSFGDWKAVETVLVDGVLHALREVCLELGGGDGDAVQEQHEIEAVLVVRRVMHLSDDAEPVGGVARCDRLVYRQRRAELRHRDFLA